MTMAKNEDVVVEAFCSRIGVTEGRVLPFLLVRRSRSNMRERCIMKVYVILQSVMEGRRTPVRGRTQERRISGQGLGASACCRIKSSILQFQSPPLSLNAISDPFPNSPKSYPHNSQPQSNTSPTGTHPARLPKK